MGYIMKGSPVKLGTIQGTSGHKQSVLKQFDVSSATVSGGDTAIENVDTSKQSEVEPGTSEAPEEKKESKSGPGSAKDKIDYSGAFGGQIAGKQI